jgi:hypothetical protein
MDGGLYFSFEGWRILIVQDLEINCLTLFILILILVFFSLIFLKLSLRRVRQELYQVEEIFISFSPISNVLYCTTTLISNVFYGYFAHYGYFDLAESSVFQVR